MKKIFTVKEMVCRLWRGNGTFSSASKVFCPWSISDSFKQLLGAEWKYCVQQ